MSVIRQLVCVVWLAAGAFAGAPPNIIPPNIILITVDTVRADRMGFLGSKLGLTPNLDTLARESVVFTHAYSQVPLTAPSHATILTGTYPQFHQVNDFQVPLAPDLPYAPAILREHGYRTSAFVGAMVLDPHAGFARGFDRGFDTYDAGFHQARPGEDRYQSTERRGGEVVAHALAWLNQHPRGPFFMWLHLYDAHDPYDPPEPYKSKYAAAPYDGEIAYVDSAVGKFLDDLRAHGLYDGALIAVMADHGEALGEHGEDTHGFFLYDETIHVPLVIKLPGAASTGKESATKSSAGTKIDDRVGLVDVLPTILQAVKIPIPQEVQGESLLSLLIPKPAPSESTGASVVPDATPDRPAYAETDYPRNTYGWSSLRALRTGKHLYIKAPRQELYDQSADPKAEHNLSSSSTAVASTLAGELDAFRQKTSSSREAPKSIVDPEAQAKLAALGYIATDGNASKASAKERGADPKDKIEIANLIHRTYLLIEGQRYQEAVPLLQQLIAKEPDTPLAYAQLGQCFVSLKDYPQAVPVLRKAVELRPDMTLPHFQLGVALLETKDIAGAVPELEMVVARVPRWEEAHLLLQMAYAQTDRMPEAIKECEQVLEFDPDHYGTNLLLGRVLELTGKPAGALPRLKKAAALEPKAPEPHMFLAEAYSQLGRKTDAARERAAAKRLGAHEEE
jgi:arylsulfatase A-like enzyme/thioredoxin-like negative regulator of GroEL